MKRLLINGQEHGEAERIIVDRSAGTITGYTGGQEVFALRGVDFSRLNYTVEGGEDAPAPSDVDMLGQALVEKELELLAMKQDNAMLGQALVELELRIMQLAQGGITP